MIRIISANLNGIRSADNKGFFSWMQKVNADVVCVQELKAHETDLSEQVRCPDGFYSSFHCAEKKGYSGVGLYCRKKPTKILSGIGIEEFDKEGRYLRVDFDYISVISLYLPSGSSSVDRQQVKFAFLAAFYPILSALILEKRDFIICGDWNIAHQEIDLKNFKSNKKNSGFLPEEREWMTNLLGNGWVDIWRDLYATNPGYTWWSNRGQAYAKNVGWRIDYQIASSGAAKCAQSANIYKDQKFSDHAPLIVDYEMQL